MTMLYTQLTLKKHGDPKIDYYYGLSGINYNVILMLYNHYLPNVLKISVVTFRYIENKSRVI